jgi:hypothetical protein
MRVPSPAASTIVRLERAVIAILSNTAESIITSTGDKPVSPELVALLPPQTPGIQVRVGFPVNVP